MSNSKKDKKGMKSVAETAATTATIVVSGKTIASVVDSGVEALKNLKRNDELPVSHDFNAVDDAAVDNKAMVTPVDMAASRTVVEPVMTEVLYKHKDVILEKPENIASDDISEYIPYAEEQPVELSDDIRLLFTEPIDEALFTEEGDMPEEELSGDMDFTDCDSCDDIMEIDGDLPSFMDITQEDTPDMTMSALDNI